MNLISMSNKTGLRWSRLTLRLCRRELQWPGSRCLRGQSAHGATEAHTQRLETRALATLQLSWLPTRTTSRSRAALNPLNVRSLSFSKVYLPVTLQQHIWAPVSAKSNPSENKWSLKEMVLQRTGAAGDGPYVFLKPKKMRGSLRFYTGSNAIIRMDAKRPIVPDTNLSLCLH